MLNVDDLEGAARGAGEGKGVVVGMVFNSNAIEVGF